MHKRQKGKLHSSGAGGGSEGTSHPLVLSFRSGFDCPVSSPP